LSNLNTLIEQSDRDLIEQSHPEAITDSYFSAHLALLEIMCERKESKIDEEKKKRDCKS